MKLTLFVNHAGSNAGRPGESTNVLRLTAPPKSDRVDDANKEVFPDESRKSVTFEAHGLTDAALAEFKGGKRVEVTFKVID